MAEAARKRNVSLPRRKDTKSSSGAKQQDSSVSMARESLTVVLVCFGAFLGLALHSHCFEPATFFGLSLGIDTAPGVDTNIMGKVGESVSYVLAELLGWCSFMIVIWAFLLARRVWVVGWLQASSSVSGTVVTILGSAVMVSAAASFVTVIAGHRGGGMVGGMIAYSLIRYVSEPGALLISFAVFILSLGVSTGVGASRLILTFRNSLLYAFSVFSDVWFVCLSLLKPLTRASVGLTCACRNAISGIVCFCFRQTVFLLKLPMVMFRALFSRMGRGAESQEDVESEDLGFTIGAETEPTELDEFKLGSSEVKVSRRSDRVDSKTRRGLAKADGTSKLRSKKLKPVGRVKKRREKQRQNNKETTNYSLPSLDYLVSSSTETRGAPKDSDLISNSRRLEKTLLDFKIGGKVVEVQPGPIITLYQFAPAAGVKVQRIVSLADDMALALKVASVRVYAPVPGAGTVGIEVPNEFREMVRLRDVLASDEYQEHDSKLTLALGKDTFGDPFVGDLSKMPHLLIAGATGTGKSVCINALLMSLIYRNTPDTLRLILIDPKMLELSLYDDIPHLKSPVVTEPKHARGVLWWAVEEMERRYRLMKSAGVRSLDSYNRRFAEGFEENSRASSKSSSEIIRLEERNVVATSGQGDGLSRESSDDDFSTSGENTEAETSYLPRVVIVVDELADLMLTVGREIEELLTRLAQKARAAGIHLILATQRPSVNVITGLIKANFPARISFKVASRIDSRTILDGSGSEKLLGHGDMLFLSPGVGRLRRLHSAFVSDEEVQSVVSFLKQQGPPLYDSSIAETINKIEENEKGFGAGGGDIEDEYDALYDQAVALVVEKGQASTSMVQRVFRIGYNRAARILEVMEREGVVGPADGAKPRQVFLSNHQE